MNTEKLKLIKKVFSNSYRVENLRELIFNLFHDHTPKESKYVDDDVLRPFKEHIDSYTCIAEYKDNYKTLDVLSVCLKSKDKLEHAKTMQRNFVAKYLNNTGKKAALVAFYSLDSTEWCLSLVKMDSKYDEQKNKYKTEFTPAQRFSFFVGENEAIHTCSKRFYEFFAKNNQSPTIEDIQEIFNVKVVTDEFYEKYKQLYNNLLKELEKIRKKDKTIDTDFKEKNISNELFCKKILSQILFLYFIQKKGWLGVEKNKLFGEGDKQFLKNLFDTAKKENKNFFNDYLEHLFYEALAKKNDNDYFKLLDCKIPFLNGGLFEPIKDYDYKNTNIKFDNKLFSNNNKTKEGDIGDGILDVFDRYNFTVHENEPLETEVAIDPEMLGKVFEKLLNEEEQKKDGAFYTPKEIVQYMCQESLIYYLAEKFSNITKEEFEKFIKYGEQNIEISNNIKQNAKNIDESLANIKVCDPAIGSGAFPVGIMLEIVRARLNLVPYIDNENKRKTENENKYNFKLQAIQNSIYGVDIKESAVEIAKLRFWLSLIIEEESKEIKTMPNLDYKIMCGNSLLKIIKDLLYNDELKTLEKLKYEFTNISDKKEKDKKRKEIDNILDKFAKKGQFDFEIFFSEVFKDSGFDIVIGNPPYIQLQEMKDIYIQEGEYKGTTYQNLYKQQNFNVYNGKGDIYCLFYEKGISLLKKKGILIYITSRQWMRAGYGEKLREYLIKYNPLLLIDLGSGIFESATVDTNILMVKKEPYQNNTLSCSFTKQKDTTKLNNYVENNSVSVKYTRDNWVILQPIEKSIKSKIEKYGKKLGEWDVQINYGIKTGCNEAFIINEEIKNKLIKQDIKSKELIKPILKGKNIKKNTFNYDNLYLINTLPSANIDIENYKAIKNWLINGDWVLKENLPLGSGKLRLEQEGKEQVFNKIKFKSRTKTSYKWFEMQNNISQNFMNYKEKLVWAETAQEMKFCIVKNKYVLDKTTFMLISKSENIIYLMKMLNSKIVEFYMRKQASCLGENGISCKEIDVVKLPIIYPTPQQEKEILEAKTDEEIENLIASYYHLTEEEFEFIKNSK